MNITLYNCLAEPNRLNKSPFLVPLTTYTGAVARQNVSIMNPILVLQDALINIRDANYCYISDFDRYYYIREKTCDANGLYTLTLNIDVLMSYKTDILMQKGIVSRQEGIYNMYLPSDVPSEVRPLVTTVKMNPVTSTGFTNQSDTYVLLAIGGK